MRTLLNPWFIAGCIIWVIIMTTRRIGHPLPMFINGYIDDAFAVPVIANLGLCFQRVVVIQNNYYVLSPGKVIFIVVYLTLVFEVFLPYISPRYVSDWKDAVLYVVGGFFFYYVMNKPIIEQKRKS